MRFIETKKFEDILIYTAIRSKNIIKDLSGEKLCWTVY